MSAFPHLHRAVVHAFLAGEVESAVELELIAAHLAACPACESNCDLQALTPASRHFVLAQGLADASTVRSSEATLDLSARESAVQLPDELLHNAKWKWLGLLGRGAHGAVYLARHKVLRDQLRAIKIVAAPLGAESDITQRILREINTIRRVPPHENLLQVFDVERIGIFHLIVMEHVLGQDLESLAVQQPEGRLDPEVAVSCILQALAALDHAAARGLVHRDLKPGNLMMTPKGLVKVLDFGLAKVRSETETSMTQGGLQGCGSAAYLAPEQARDFASADVRSDLYSLGCTLYRLIAGHPPFGPHSGHHAVWQLHAAHSQEKPAALREVCPWVSPELSGVVMRLLAKEPAERFDLPRDAAQALLPFASNGGRQSAVHWLGENLERPAISRRLPSAAASLLWRSALALVFIAAVSLAIVLRVQTKAGIVELEVEDPRVDVKIDDAPVDRTRIKLKQSGDRHWLHVEVAPGKREVTISRPGFKVASENVLVHSGRTSPIRIRLLPESSLNGSSSEAEPEPRAAKPLDRTMTLVLSEGGRWTIEEGELRHYDGRGEQWLLFGDRDWTDYDFSYEVRHEGFPLGVTAIYRSPDDDHFQHFGYAWLDLKTCLAEYRDPKSFYHRVLKDGQPLRLLLDEPIASERWYRLKVEVRGDESKFYCDDRHLLTVEDNPYDHGRVGVRIWRRWQGSTRFRDIRVTGIDGGVLWEGLPDLPEAAVPEQPASLPGPAESGEASVAPPNVGEDLLKPGSIWTGWRSYRKGAWAGATVSYDLHVESREGPNFAGHMFDNGPGRNRCEVTGKVEGTRISWRETSTRTANITEVQGTISGSEMRLTITGKHANGAVYMEGDGALQLKNGIELTPP